MFNDNVPQKEFLTFCSLGNFQGRRFRPLNLKRNGWKSLCYCVYSDNWHKSGQLWLGFLMSSLHYTCVEIQRVVRWKSNIQGYLHCGWKTLGQRTLSPLNLIWVDNSRFFWKYLEMGMRKTCLRLRSFALSRTGTTHWTQCHWPATMCAYARVWVRVTTWVVAKSICQHRYSMLQCKARYNLSFRL